MNKKVMIGGLIILGIVGAYIATHGLKQQYYSAPRRWYPGKSRRMDLADAGITQHRIRPAPGAYRKIDLEDAGITNTRLRPYIPPGSARKMDLEDAGITNTRLRPYW